MDKNLSSSKKEKDKLTLKEIFGNVFYVLKYAIKIDRLVVILSIILNIFYRVSNALFSTIILKYVIDGIVAKKAISNMLPILIIAVFVLVLNNFLNQMIDHWREIRLVKTYGKIARELIKKSARIDLICYDQPEYFDDFVIAASQAEEMILQSIESVSAILGDGLAIISCSILIMTINPLIALLPITGFIINILTRFKIQKLEYEYSIEKKVANRKADYSKRVFYQPEFAKEIKLSDIEVPLKNQFIDAIYEEQNIAKKYSKRISILSLINWTFSFTLLQDFGISVLLGYMALVKKNIALGDFAATGNATSVIQWRLDQINYAFINFQKVGQYAHRFRRFMEYKENLETFIGDTSIPENDSCIEIKNMSFRYDGNENDTLKNINMTIKKGERIAIVGENGAGKTTFVKLLMRLYDVTDGAILYNGVDIKCFTTKEYRDKIAAVFQDYQMYGATLGENVKMDLVDEHDYNSLHTALSNADFDSKFDKLSNGLNTEITREFNDDGTIFSGGESQKVAIARMFAGKNTPPIAILDEPSSALDPKAEYILNTNIMEKAINSTVIFISHRLSTTRTADRIYMFENGEIIEQGTHKELMDNNSAYAEMFKKQSKYYKLNI